MNKDEISDMKLILVSLFLCFLFYLLIFILSNITNSDESKKPSNFLWDLRQQGYTENPLSDRYWNIRNSINEKKEDNY